MLDKFEDLIITESTTIWQEEELGDIEDLIQE